MKKRNLYIAVLMSLSATLLIGCMLDEETDAIVPEDHLESSDTIVKEGIPEGAAVPEDNHVKQYMGDLGSQIGDVIVSGSTAGMNNDFTPACASSNAPDASHTWTAPFSGTFVFSTPFTNFDTVLDIRSYYDSSQSLGCDDDAAGTLQSSVTVNLNSGQTVIVVTDGYSGSSGQYQLAIRHVLPFASGWTGWLDRDDPSGNGDYETLRELINEGQVCANPISLECQTTSGAPWYDMGEIFRCHGLEGGYCVNADQPDGSCQDYRVRFQCP